MVDVEKFDEAYENKIESHDVSIILNQLPEILNPNPEIIFTESDGIKIVQEKNHFGIPITNETIKIRCLHATLNQLQNEFERVFTGAEKITQYFNYLNNDDSIKLSASFFKNQPNMTIKEFVSRFIDEAAEGIGVKTRFADPEEFGMDLDNEDLFSERMEIIYSNIMKLIYELRERGDFDQCEHLIVTSSFLPDDIAQTILERLNLDMKGFDVRIYCAGGAFSLNHAIQHLSGKVCIVGCESMGMLDQEENYLLQNVLIPITFGNGFYAMTVDTDKMKLFYRSTRFEPDGGVIKVKEKFANQAMEIEELPENFEYDLTRGKLQLYADEDKITLSTAQPEGLKRKIEMNGPETGEHFTKISPVEILKAVKEFYNYLIGEYNNLVSPITVENTDNKKLIEEIRKDFAEQIISSMQTIYHEPSETVLVRIGKECLRRVKSSKDENKEFTQLPGDAIKTALKEGMEYTLSDRAGSNASSSTFFQNIVHRIWNAAERNEEFSFTKNIIVSHGPGIGSVFETSIIIGSEYSWPVADANKWLADHPEYNAA